MCEKEWRRGGRFSRVPGRVRAGKEKEGSQQWKREGNGSIDVNKKR